MNANLVVNLRILAGFEAPFLFSIGSVQSIEIAVPASDVQAAIGDCRRAVNDVASLEFPFQIAGSGIQRVDVSVSAGVWA